LSEDHLQRINNNSETCEEKEIKEILAKEKAKSQNSQDYHFTKKYKSWKNLKFIPNKKRFFILSTIVMVLELMTFLILEYVFIEKYPAGLSTYGFFILPLIAGVIIAYIVKNRKEAFAIGAITALGSIVLFTAIYAIVGSIIERPDITLKIDFTFFMLPIFAIMFQVAIAFTLARMLTIYRAYSRDATNEIDANNAKENDIEEE
jgi:hypothetical protein